MAEPDATHLRFRRTGGVFAGNVLEISLGERELSSPGAAELRALVTSADLADAARRSPIRGTGADRYQYELEVDCAGERRHVIASDGAVPHDLRPLVQLLERWAAGEHERTTG